MKKAVTLKKNYEFRRLYQKGVSAVSGGMVVYCRKNRMHFHPAIAPFKAAVLPLSKKLGDKAKEIQLALSADWMVDFDDTGSIGKRYRRQDEIGTPFCVTVDFATIGDDTTPADNCVTVRDRDTMGISPAAA